MATVPLPASACPIYERRRPEGTALHQLLLEHLESFLAMHEVPSFVAKALRRYVDCGVLARGF